MQGDIHLSADMTGDRDQDTHRRATAYSAGLEAAASDPMVAIKMALGRAYSDTMTYGKPSAAAVEELVQLFKDKPAVQTAALVERDRLADLVAHRSLGGRSACEVSRQQLALLDAALHPQNQNPAG